MPKSKTPPDPQSPPTTREQLIAAATRIFAAKGYAAATTREICNAAGANVASIHYHFGDKAGLYRAVLAHPIHAVTDQFGRFDDPRLPFEQAIRQVLAPLVQTALDDSSRDLLVTRLHLREKLEPSPIYREVIAGSIQPQHDALAALLARHCALAAPDADIQTLAFAIVALASDYCLSRASMRQLAPAVFERAHAAEHIVERLVGYSVALLEHEQARRRTHGAHLNPNHEEPG